MEITGKTQLIGLIGWPVSHSFSPAMHNAAAAAAGLDWLYVPLPVHPDDIAAAVHGLPALGFRGVNVTVPHKQAVIPYLNEIDPGAKGIGAVNTILINKSHAFAFKLIGYNTDWSGFLADLEALGVPVAGRDCLVLGAGGSARAVAYALASAGGRVQVLARRVAQARQLAADLEKGLPANRRVLTGRPFTELAAAVRHMDAPLIVNTTPLGMVPAVNASPWPDGLPFPPGTFVYDLVYNPRRTRLMQQADAAGCRAANGLGMLVQQGALAFQLWTGVMPDTAVMRQAIESAQA
ncbi:MAG: shikimate dehydrogenase [Anaerolineae bacterium]